MSDLTGFARQLMRLNEKQQRTNSASAIFGSVSELPSAISQVAPYRIGLWPCISEAEPVIAMGLWITLAHWLERWQDIVVYRLFTELEGEPEDFKWSIEKSQFAVDDWSVDSLDENIAIWGELEQTDNQWRLTTYLENDLLVGEDVDTQEFTITSSTLEGLFTQIAPIAQFIVDNIGATRIDDGKPIPDMSIAINDATRQFFDVALQWDVQLLTLLWGVEWADDVLLDDYDYFIEQATEVNAELAAWITTKSIAHALKPGYSVVGDLLLQHLDTLIEAFPEYDVTASIVAPQVFVLGNTQEAYQLLQKSVENYPTHIYAWLNLASMIAATGRITEAAKLLQKAITEGHVNYVLYRAYGNALVEAEQNGEYVDKFILIDENVVANEDAQLLEAVAAYDNALALNPNDLLALRPQLLQLAFLDDLDAFWIRFGQLIALDTSGNDVRDIVDNLYDVEDITPGINMLAERAKETNQLETYLNIAALHLVHDEGLEALQYLEQAQKLTDKIEDLAEIERMMLVANDPMFEQRIGDLTAIIDANNSPASEDVEFLENASENAPNYVDIHLMLAKAYKLWGDKDAALEVLLDTNESLPTNPYVLDLLAQTLWDAGEQELAFQYLNQGLQTYPFFIPLIVRTGRYLFDNDQLEDAKTFLARAEEIAPRDPDLDGVRRYIANQMATNPHKYDTD